MFVERVLAVCCSQYVKDTKMKVSHNEQPLLQAVPSAVLNTSKRLK